MTSIVHLPSDDFYYLFFVSAKYIRSFCICVWQVPQVLWFQWLLFVSVASASDCNDYQRKEKFFSENWLIYLYLKGRATYLERSSLSKLTNPNCSWLRLNTTKYLKFIAIIFVFQNNAPFSKKQQMTIFALLQ